MASKKIELILLGIAISVAAQFISLQAAGFLPLTMQRLDPLFELLYSSIGLGISVIAAAFFIFKSDWFAVLGLILGILLWWPFLGIFMALNGAWL